MIAVPTLVTNETSKGYEKGYRMTVIERRDTIESRDQIGAVPAGEAADGDQVTVERAKRGDVAAFETLYRRHVGRVYALCMRAAADPSRAQELVQDVFVRAWERLQTFEHRARFSTWLYRLAVNRVTDAVRGDIRRADRRAPVEAASAVAAPPGLEPELRLDLEAAIRALPPGARWAFVLHDVEGLSHEDIAALTAVQVGTSKSQLYRARRLLREMLTR